MSKSNKRRWRQDEILTKKKMISMAVSLLLVFTEIYLSLPLSTATPIACPSDSSIRGYSNWDNLKSDVYQYATDALNYDNVSIYNNGIFTICPGSLFQLDEQSSHHEMHIDSLERSNGMGIYPRERRSLSLIIQCGANGKFADNCTIDGGKNHFTIEGNGFNITLRGLRMAHAKEASVLVYESDGVMFEDCIWTNNRNKELENCEKGCTSAVFGISSNMDFSGCRFLYNVAPFGTIHLLDGSLIVDKSLFVRNSATGAAVLYAESEDDAEPIIHSTASAISTYNASIVKISNTCFLRNACEGAATVKVEQGTSLEAGEGMNNYFDRNAVKEPELGDTEACSAILHQSNTDWDLNECIESDGKNCSIDPCGFVFENDIWGFDCGEYGDQCRKYDFTSCNNCTQSSDCFWCSSDAVCSSSPIKEISYSISSWDSFTIYASCNATDYGSTCERTSNFFDDPLYSSQKWVYDLIKVEPVWEAGITGKGVHIRINDEGVDADHPDIAPNFEKSASCELYLPENGDNHGTACASIAAASTNNHCAVGIAPDAILSSCRILGDPNTTTPEFQDGTYLSLHHDKMDISSNSWGFISCEHKYARRRLNSVCPFLRDAEGSPCTARECSGIDWSSPQPPAECSSVIIRYCYYEYENDVSACIEFLDLFVDCKYNALSDSYQQQLTKGITEGRGGKGVIYVFAGGNDFDIGGDTNFEGTTNSRFIITVGSVGKLGTHSSYSNSGASLFISGPGGDHEFLRNHIVAKNGGGCRDAGKGTSYATPVVAGVVALMLEVNSELGWRDVQGILATTSQRVNPDDSSWFTNAAGCHHSYKYGFGLVDAEAAIAAAKVWENFSNEKPIVVESGIVNLKLIDSSSSDVVSVVELKPSKADENITSEVIVESAVLYLDLEHPSRGDLKVILTSPSGTESIMHPSRRPENTVLEDQERWKLTTLRAWGEPAVGNWSISIVDEDKGVYDDCVDLPGWYHTYETDEGESFNLTCWSFELHEICEDGTFFIDDEDLENLTSPDGKLPTEACCECGGGQPASSIDSILRSWTLAVYSHVLTDKRIKEKMIFSVIHVPNRDMDAYERSTFEKSIIDFINNSDLSNSFGVSNIKVNVYDQFVSLFKHKKQKIRHHRFRGLVESTGDGSNKFYNQIAVEVEALCYNSMCKLGSLTTLFHSSFNSNPDGLKEILTSISITNYFIDIENVTLSDVFVPDVTSESKTSSDIPTWFWVVVIIGGLAVLFLLFFGWAYVNEWDLRWRHRKVSAAESMNAGPNQAREGSSTVGSYHHQRHNELEMSIEDLAVILANEDSYSQPEKFPTVSKQSPGSTPYAGTEEECLNHESNKHTTNQPIRPMPKANLSRSQKEIEKQEEGAQMDHLKHRPAKEEEADLKQPAKIEKNSDSSWECIVCTYKNKNSDYLACEICFAPKP